MSRKAKRKPPVSKAPVSKAPKKKSVPFHWVMIGVLLAAIGGYYLLFNTDQTAQALPSYAEEDVARDRPFEAIHEMGAGPPIPFLPADRSQPKIVVPSDYFNFGQIGARDVVRRKFVIRNEGDAPLTISRAYTTCGCTTAEFTARVIPPGKVAVVTLLFNAGFHDTRGQTVDRGIIIENNDRRNSKAEIWTRATVAWR